MFGSERPHPAPWIALAVVLGCLSALLGPTFDATHTILSALRVLHGQRIYREFPVAYGPVAAWTLVPFLAAAPSLGWGVVLASGALNGVAVAAAWRIVLAASGGVVAARNAAVMTCVWFVPVFGTYYMDHLAYVCALAALTAYLTPLSPIGRGAVSGLLLALAFHSKQSVGAAAALALAVAVLFVDGRAAVRERTNQWVILFFTIGHGAMLAAVAGSGSVTDYLTHAVLLPVEYAVTTGRWLWRLPFALVLPFGIDPVAMVRATGRGRLLFYPVVLAVYGSYVWLGWRYREWRHGHEETRAPLLAGLFLVLSSLWGSILLGRLYAHVTFGVWTLVGLETAWMRSPWPRRAITTGGVLLGLAHIGTVHWTPSLAAGPSGALRPMRLLDARVESDIAGARDAIEYLRARDGRLALLSDSAEIIALSLGRPTFEPVEHYMQGLTVPRDPQRYKDWERRFRDGLEGQQVRFLLWDPSEPDRPRTLDLGRGALREFIASRYEVRASFGRYVILERRAAPLRLERGPP